MSECLACSGTGKVTCDVCDGKRYTNSYEKDGYCRVCNRCKWSGKIDCKECDGLGKVKS